MYEYLYLYCVSKKNIKIRQTYTKIHQQQARVSLAHLYNKSITVGKLISSRLQSPLPPVHLRFIVPNNPSITICTSPQNAAVGFTAIDAIIHNHSHSHSQTSVHSSSAVACSQLFKRDFAVTISIPQMFQLALQACYLLPSLTAPFLACSSGVAVLLQKTHKNETK
jgi:hypothetical protein